MPPLFGVSGLEGGAILQNSLFFSLLAGNLRVETGSRWTASATIYQALAENLGLHLSGSLNLKDARSSYSIAAAASRR
jgi:hypothetical protein